MYPKTDEVKVIRTGPGVPKNIKGKTGIITHKNEKRIIVTFPNGDYWFFAPTDLRVKKTKKQTT